MDDPGGSQIKNSSENESHPLHLTAINISKDGICLRTEYFFIPDHLFQLDFSFMDKNIHTLARVVWSEKTACGLQFLNPNELAEIFEKVPND